MTKDKRKDDAISVRERTETERKKAAAAFADRWKDRGYEKGEAQTFWIEFLEDIVGVEKPTSVIKFEKTVPIKQRGTKTTKFIDGYIPKTLTLIEQKSRDVDLDKPQPAHDNKTPYEQAEEYGEKLDYDEQPRWIIVSNFREIRIHDMNARIADPVIIALEDLRSQYHRFDFLYVPGKGPEPDQVKVSAEAGEVVAKLYDALRKAYKHPDDPATLESLNRLCVRLVFCFYAEDSGIFGKDQFRNYLADYRPEQMAGALAELFKVLDQREEDRKEWLAPALTAFPYVNGGLFAEEDLSVPLFDEDIARIILEDASEHFDWSPISPTIFGAIFESTLNPETRRAGGMHYTSVENIHKLIDPLFLNDLREELDAILQSAPDKRVLASDPRHKTQAQKKYEDRLKQFQEKLGKLTFFDPACGSGNFLTETYLSLRNLENRALQARFGGQIVMEEMDPIKVKISQFHGIEINGFAVSVAQTALWIAENQTMKETERIVNMQLDFLPLTTAAHIVEGNALRIDWNDVLPARECDYIVGNPPFVGYSQQTKQQKGDIQSVYSTPDGKPYKNSGKIDYVAGWFFKAAEYMYGTAAHAAFVSTNSISMGDQVAPIWEPLRLRFGTRIDFAWRTFVWNNESSVKAQVHVVVVGFSDTHAARKSLLFAGDRVIECDHINAYLTNGPDVLITRRKKPLCSIPQLVGGNRPVDGGHLLLTPAEYDALICSEPKAKPFLKRYMMGKELINGDERWCLWLVDCDPRELRAMPSVMERVQKVKEMRQASPDSGANKLADTPALFREQLNPDRFLAIPVVSTENRRYIPMKFLGKETIVGNKIFILQDADMYEFAILTSNVHMAWMRAVAGRMKSDYSYSKDIVYNNFPWPDPTPAQKERIEKTAQGILDARALYPGASLADLYDEAAMPPELRKAHQENDKAVMTAYGFRKDGKWLTEAETVAALMEMYAELVAEEEKKKNS